MAISGMIRVWAWEEEEEGRGLREEEGDGERERERWGLTLDKGEHSRFSRGSIASFYFSKTMCRRNILLVQFQLKFK